MCLWDVWLWQWLFSYEWFPSEIRRGLSCPYEAIFYRRLSLFIFQVKNVTLELTFLAFFILPKKTTHVWQEWLWELLCHMLTMHTWAYWEEGDIGLSRLNNQVPPYLSDFYELLLCDLPKGILELTLILEFTLEYLWVIHNFTREHHNKHLGCSVYLR